MSISKENNRIAKNTLFLYIRMLFVLIVSLYTSRVVLNTLGVVDFGVFNVVAGFVTMFSFLNTSLVGAIQRYYNYEGAKYGDEGIRNVYNTALFIQSLLAIIVVLLLETFGLWYVNNVMVIPVDRLDVAKFLFHTSVLSTAIVIMQIPYSAAVVSFEKMDYYAVVGIIDVILKLLIVIALPYLPYDKLFVYALLSLLIAVADFLLYFIYSKRHFVALRFKRMFDRTLFRSMLSFSGWNVVGTFSTMAYTQGLNLLLNFFFGPIVNAARGVAAQVMNAIHGFSINITVAFRPQLVESYAKGNYGKTRQFLFIESKICFIMLLLLSLPVILEIKYILHLWLGDAVPEYTEIFTVLVLVQMLMSAFNPAFTQISHATGKVKLFQLATSALALLILPLSYFVLKTGAEPYSVFLVTIVMTLATLFVCMLVVKKIFPYSIREYCVQVLFPCLMVSVLVPVLPLLICYYMEPSFIRLLIVVGVCSILIIFLSYLIILRAKEREVVKGYVRGLIKR